MIQGPTWLRELTTLLPACSQFLLSGNVHDQYLVPAPGGGPDLHVKPLESVLVDMFVAQGATGVIIHDISQGARLAAGDPAAVTEAIGHDVGSIRAESLDDLLGLIEACSGAECLIPLVIRSASRLTRDVGELSPEEFSFYRSVDRLARRPRAPLTPPSGRSLFSHVVWILDHERDVPHWFSLHNEFIRSVVLPMPDADDRRRLAARLVRRLASSDQSSDQSHDGSDGIDEATDALVTQTAGLPLSAMNRVIDIHRDQKLPISRVDDAARSYRIGVVENPWRGDEILRRLRAELTSDGETGIRSRVLGQDMAVHRTLDILARSAAGLTAAQAGENATRPRGVLFFAGPTGVGKTELAKSITRLLFDDQSAYIRFDMSEFAAEHTAARLIGAPPGYTGFEAGGELTNSIRQRPFSVILFDEVEKAHPRILDKFLQVLDDGRLTDGRGETVFFTEAVIIFTSNLGMYAEVDETLPDGTKVKVRRLTVDPEVAEHAEVATRVEQSVREHFTTRIGRPELLNRIGDNIVVFDFVRPPTAKRILAMMMANVVERVRKEHGIDMRLSDDATGRLERECLDRTVLEMGGRGIGARLETVLINPLARALVADESATSVTGARTVDLRGEGAEWIVTMT